MTSPAPALTQAPATILRRATVADVPAIQKIINHFADKGEMLHRSMNELYEHVRDFVVAEVDGKVLGCAAVQVTWDDLAELKCVAVSPDGQGRGLGKRIIDRCLEEAAEVGLRRVFALTYKPDFFAKFGFKIIDRNLLPHKVWGECIKCHKFPNCNEIAMMYHVPGETNRGATT